MSTRSYSSMASTQVCTLDFADSRVTSWRAAPIAAKKVVSS